MKTITMNVDEMIDQVAKPEDYYTVEFQKEIGYKDKYKLYIHLNGRTIVRIGKLTANQFAVEGCGLRFT